jgi:hypothetical protein
MDIDESATAHHEAGHVVVGVHLGFSLKCVCLAPRTTEDRHGIVTDWEGRLGGTEFDPFPQFDADSRIIMTAAGPIAAFMFDPNSVAGKFVGADQGMIDQTINAAGYDISTRERLIAEAKQLVSDNWDSIKRVAHALVERRNLSGDEVQKLISSSVGLDADPR